ncbi:hypothetical protein EK21DRAFT_110115 [Setomelanomma holmii]|uniref:Uncharacterized protein n=1 Tax=Setomelanomma holmii TaxID=210430 RepID=A0A9P4HCP1_9PLEO|nr:hypothetical protein EK21DRAFT_110115 [Setomelanomma holmii]
MQLTFTTLSALLAAAMTVGASPLEARQDVPRVRATFYNNGGCGPPETWAEDTVFVQDTPGVCHDLTVGPFQSTYFNESSVTRTLRFYNAKCADRFGSSVNHIDITPGNPTPGCKAQAILSWETL